jgi:uncharacterized protein YecE (DUF72 family)
MAGKTKAGDIRIGIGGWTFEPWRGVFYPDDLIQRRELEFASRAVTSIEINGTYYSSFKPDSWRKWRDETPDDFIFSVKASRFCTNRKVLAEASESVGKFLTQGLTELGPKLGPINWQFMGTKKFQSEDFGAFLALLPDELDGVRLRHAVEVRNQSFATQAFYDLCAQHNVAIVYGKTEDEDTNDSGRWPEIDEPTADFTYARFMSSHEHLENGATDEELNGFAKQCRAWAKRGDVFAYFIAGAKVRNPAAAQALIKRLKK